MFYPEVTQLECQSTGYILKASSKPMIPMCNQCWEPLLYSLHNCFSNFNVHRNHQGFLLKCRVWFSKSRWDPRLHISNKLPGNAHAAGQWVVDARVWQQRQCSERSPKRVLSHCNWLLDLSVRVCLAPEPHWTRRKRHRNPSHPSQDGQDPGSGLRSHAWAVSELNCAGLEQQSWGMTWAAFVARIKGSKT